MREINLDHTRAVGAHIPLALMLLAGGITAAVMLQRTGKCSSGEKLAKMKEPHLAWSTINVYTELQRPTCVIKCPVPRIDKASVEPETDIGGLPQALSFGAVKVGVGMNKSSAPPCQHMPPHLTHKSPIEIRLRTGKQRIDCGVTEHRNSPRVRCQFPEEV